MCASIGVDPLASSKGFWSEMLGVGDFYYELGVQIIEVCMAHSHKTGGLMELEDLRRRVARSRMRHKMRKQEAQKNQSDPQSVSILFKVIPVRPIDWTGTFFPALTLRLCFTLYFALI